MGVIFHGRSARLKRELCNEFIMWSLPKLLGKRKRVDLVVAFCREKEGIEGRCFNRSKPNNKARAFTIHIDNRLKIRESLETLAHEMVHLKQMYFGEYLHTDAGYLWKGTLYSVNFDCPKFMCNEYWELPWEIEAYGRQPGLIFQWMFYQGYDVSESWYRS